MSRSTSSVNRNCEQPAAKTPCCPDCGSLECLCRPRFFAGQLLSEQDLNRLDQYIKNKNRLHNRNQHGWGVVNGLLVLCDPCGEVIVTEGYAVDPCGDDIVVCQDVAVNICKLIRQCKQVKPQPDCQMFHRPPNTHCDDVEEEWVLTIQYEEWASRGVTALRGNACSTSACCCGAGAGSAKGCVCGAKGNQNTALNNVQDKLKRRGAPAECEPTVTCEGYSFGVYKKPVKPDDRRGDDRAIRLEGAFWEAFNCCAEPLIATIPPMPDLRESSSTAGPLENANAITKWCCQLRENLLNYFLTHRNTSCEIIDFLRAVNCPNVVSPGSFNNDFIRSFYQLFAAWLEGLKVCFCLSLLPPPPQATCDTRVPLASVRIRARDCKVLSICNWTTERQMMITWPTVSYWLSIVQIEDLMREVLDRLCCRSMLTIFDRLLGRVVESNVAPNVEGDVFRAAAQPETVTFAQTINSASASIASEFDVGQSSRLDSFSKLVDSVISRGDQSLDLGAVLNSVSPRFKLPDNGKALSKLEAKNIPLLLMSELLVKPVLKTLGGDRSANVQAQRAFVSTGDESTAGLQQQLNEMREQLKQQDAKIKALQSKPKQ